MADNPVGTAGNFVVVVENFAAFVADNQWVAGNLAPVVAAEPAGTAGHSASVVVADIAGLAGSPDFAGNFGLVESLDLARSLD